MLSNAGFPPLSPARCNLLQGYTISLLDVTGTSFLPFRRSVSVTADTLLSLSDPLRYSLFFLFVPCHSKALTTTTQEGLSIFITCRNHTYSILFLSFNNINRRMFLIQCNTVMQLMQLWPVLLSQCIF